VNVNGRERKEKREAIVAEFYHKPGAILSHVLDLLEDDQLEDLWSRAETLRKDRLGRQTARNMREALQ
jgi:hypothetical protein